MLKRIYTLVIAVVVIAVAVTGLIAFEVISRYNDDYAHRYLTAMSQLTVSQISEGTSVEQAAALTLEIFSVDNDSYRITAIDRQGNVFFDNKADPAGMDNHLFRPEIAQAFRTGTGNAIRSSDTVNEDMLYLAMLEPENDFVIRTSMPLYVHKSALYSLLFSMTVILLVVVALLAVIGTFLVRYLTRPLTDLKNTAEAMRQGDLSARTGLLIDESSEMAVLAATFNEMASKLQESMTELEDRNARLDAILDAISDPVLAVDHRLNVTFMNAHAKSVFGRKANPEKAVYPLILITHSEQAESLAQKSMLLGDMFSEELALDTENGVLTYQIIASPVLNRRSDGVIMTFHDISQQRKVQKMRSEFVANVTHELKTPLTSIRGFIETLRSGAMENTEVAGRFLEIIDIEAERLHHLINDILVLSEIEMNKEEWDLERFDLNTLIDDVIVLLDDQAAEKKIGIIVQNETVPMLVNASRHRIKQLLINLVDNAIKYNYEGGQVVIEANRTDDGKVEILVQDSGPGIAPEHQDRIFERFYRVDKSRSKEMGGTGLGLSIVKHIAQLYHGEAGVESSPGEGSTFKITMSI